MRGRLAMALGLAALAMAGIMPQAHAHLTGVFAYFVQDMNEPTASTRLLRQQLDAVSARVEQLRPEVEAARALYEDHSASALAAIRFYDIYVGNAVGALWAGAQDPIDVIASVELLQRRLDGDLGRLADLGEVYADLTLKQESLRRFADLLEPFEIASLAREERLADPPGGLISPYAELYIAYEIAEDWEALRASTFALYFRWVARRIADQGLEAVLEPAAFPNSWQLGEETLNALAGGDAFPFIEDARFYLRADHINFSARIRSHRDSYHLLTIGQLERTGPASVQYRIEAIYMDGMPIDPSDADVQREVYDGNLMEIDMASMLPPDNGGAIFEQHNGFVLFRAR